MPPCETRRTDSFDRAIKKLSKKFRAVEKTIVDAITSLKDTPIPGDAKRIPGFGVPVYKIRLKGEQSGKRGGYRFIYYHAEMLVVALAIYAKTDTEDMSHDQIAALIREAGLMDGQTPPRADVAAVIAELDEGGEPSQLELDVHQSSGKE